VKLAAALNLQSAHLFCQPPSHPSTPKTPWSWHFSLPVPPFYIPVISYSLRLYPMVCG